LRRRPLFESLVARAVEQAVKAERRRCRVIARGWAAAAGMTGEAVAEHIAKDIGPDDAPSGPW
jgi:hypothetical protein